MAEREKKDGYVRSVAHHTKGWTLCAYVLTFVSTHHVCGMRLQVCAHSSDPDV